jgi:hypothetical protein
MTAHGLRKGSATHVSCATTAPPPIASIANRGDWSLGKVLDVYWQFAEVGDAYLAMHDIGARGPQPAAEPRLAAISAGCGPFLCLGRPRPGRNFFVVAAAGCGPFVPAFVAYDT